jgi:hypothetical protein
LGDDVLDGVVAVVVAGAVVVGVAAVGVAVVGVATVAVAAADDVVPAGVLVVVDEKHAAAFFGEFDQQGGFPPASAKELMTPVATSRPRAAAWATLRNMAAAVPQTDNPGPRQASAARGTRA